MEEMIVRAALRAGKVAWAVRKAAEDPKKVQGLLHRGGDLTLYGAHIDALVALRRLRRAANGSRKSHVPAHTVDDLLRKSEDAAREVVGRAERLGQLVSDMQSQKSYHAQEYSNVFDEPMHGLRRRELAIVDQLRHIIEAVESRLAALAATEISRAYMSYEEIDDSLKELELDLLDLGHQIKEMAEGPS
jgi:hypothetical protein